MRKNKNILLIITALSTISLTGCDFLSKYISINTATTKDNTTNVDDSNSSKDSNINDSSSILNVTSKLVIKTYPKLSYYKYDMLDLSSLVVSLQQVDEKSNIVDSKNIDNYTLKYEDNSKVIDGTQLLKVGTFKVIISYEDASPVSFEYSVRDVKNFSQTISVNTDNVKTTYKVNEKINKDGLIVNLKTTYISDKENSQTKKIDDYSLSINDQSIDEYYLPEIGQYTVKVSYITIDGDLLSTSYQINVEEDKKQPIEDNKVASKRLVIRQLPNQIYYKYDILSLDGLKIIEQHLNVENEVLSSIEITDYILTYKASLSRVIDSIKLLDIGEFEISVSKNECISTSFKYFVNDISNFTQSLKIVKPATKLKYVEDEKFDKSGLQIQLNTTYNTNEKVEKTQLIEDYTILIDSIDATNYIFTKAGIYTIDVEYTGWENQKLKVSYSIEVEIDQNVVENKLIILNSPTLNYYKYDTLDLSSLHIASQSLNKKSQIINQEEITDYKLSYKNDTKLVEDKIILNTIGTYTIVVSKDGFTSVEFTYTVTDITNFNQKIEITNNPTKVNYLLDESFSSSGLTVLLTTTYTTNENKKYTKVIDDYTLNIEGSDIPLKFTQTGSFKINVLYSGWEKQILSTFFTITVSEKAEYMPHSYIDNTIDIEDDNAVATLQITNLENPQDSDKGYYSPSEVINSYNINQYAKRSGTSEVLLPSVGKTPLLIVPIITVGDEDKATDANLKLIKKAFFGNSEDLHFESLHSYYYQSSNGRLDLTGGITDYYNPSTDENGNSDLKNSDWTKYTSSSVTNILAKQVTNWVKATYTDLDMKVYDSNNDGYIDGLWMIYLHEQTDSDTPFWAFKHYLQKIDSDIENPNPNLYGWASIAFINDKSYGTKKSGKWDNADCDAHTLIHETGHMLGLNDYYSYAYSGYSALGKIDMMENNLNDHNGYSKLLLGWTKPYIVYKNCEIEIPSSQKDDAAVVIFDDENINSLTKKDGKVQFNCFNEYMVFELFTPKNLNKQGYDCYSVNPLTETGIRALHVDNRLFTWQNRGGVKDVFISENGTAAFNSTYTLNGRTYQSALLRIINNTESGNRAESNTFSGQLNIPTGYDYCDEVRWISADGKILEYKYIYKNGVKYIDGTNSHYAQNSSLFKANTNFSLSLFASQFNNSAFNNGKEFSANVKIKSINNL